MCLAIPAKIIKITNSTADIEIGGIIKKVSLDLIDESVSLTIGDYVIIHAGFAIQKLDEEDAKEALTLLSQVGI